MRLITSVLTVLPLAALALTGCGLVGGGDDDVVAVRKDGHRVTAGELVAAGRQSGKQPKNKASRACQGLLESFIADGGKVTDKSAFTKVCTAAVSHD